MYSSNLRILILEQEHNRIRDYVSRVSHRATGGLLFGSRFSRSGTDWLLITQATVGVPDERLQDESCVNHPFFTAADTALALDDRPDVRFVGRWHAHLDGMNRPSSGDLDWALEILEGSIVPMSEVLHPIAISMQDEVKLFPYLVTHGAMTFQKTSWQVAPLAEIERIRRNDPAPVQPERVVDAQIFSLQKTRDLLREERESVAALPGVVRCDVQDEDAFAVLEVEVDFEPQRMVLRIAAEAFYPVHAPGLEMQFDGEARAFTSRVLREWNSACQIADLVEEAITRLKPTEPDDSVPFPQVDEADPRKRELAVFKAAGYGVQVTVTETGSYLLNVTSAVLERDRKRFYAILPAGYPADPPVVSLAPANKPLAEVQFEPLASVPEDFLLLSLVEKLHPAAREQRAQAARKPERGASGPAMFLVLLFLLVLGGVGYVWATGMSRDFSATLARFTAAPGPSPAAPSATASPRDTTPSPSPAAGLTLIATRSVLGVVCDAGPHTNLTVSEAQWVLQTALRPVRAEAVQVDLQHPTVDHATVRKALKGAQAVVIFTYGAGANQASLVDFARTLGVPCGVLSMSPGDRDPALQTGLAFYQAVERHGGRDGAQRSLLELIRLRRLDVRAGPSVVAPAPTGAPTKSSPVPAKSGSPQGVPTQSGSPQGVPTQSGSPLSVPTPSVVTPPAADGASPTAPALPRG